MPARVTTAASRGKRSAERGQRAPEQGGVVEGVERVAGAAGDQYQPTCASRVHPMELQRQLHAHAVPEKHRAPDARGVEHCGQVLGELGDGGADACGRHRGLPVAAVHPVDDPEPLVERRAKVLPGKTVTGQSIAEHHGGAANALDLNVDLGAIRSRHPEGPGCAGRGGPRGHGIATHRAIV